MLYQLSTFVPTLSSIFDLPTQKAKVRSRATPTKRSRDLTPPRHPNLFLRSLFLPSSKRYDGDGKPSRPKSRSSGKRRLSFLRPASAPNDPNHHGKPVASAISTSSETAAEPSISPLIIAAPQPRPFVVHANTDPLPRLPRDPPEFPRALVVSGLEHASFAEQSTLAQALNRRQVVFEPVAPSDSVNGLPRRTPSRNRDFPLHDKSNNVHPEGAEYQGTWNMPYDFILLDLFAMSHTILVQKHIRDAFRALPFVTTPVSHSRMHSSHSNPPTPSQIQSPIPLPPRTPPLLSPHPLRHRASRSHLLQPLPIVPKQLIPRDFITFLQQAAQEAYVSSQLSLYLSDLFSAVRHHPMLDGTFLTARSMNDAKDLARAGRVLGTDPTGGELLREYANSQFYEDYEDDFEGQGSSTVHDYIASGSESVTIDVPRGLTPSGSAKGYDSTSTSGSQDPSGSLFVSEAAIARVVPRAVTHRLRVRDGPWDEILASAVFGATFQPKPVNESSHEYGWDTRSTIKDILVDILAEV
ncbi:hypothetical protein H0H92_009696 [Tricholoma furcatifolium]|nr:hypothetical protein H0H92_009696 [Tricholoma furcatifolium]